MAVDYHNIQDIRTLRWDAWVSNANEALGIRSKMSWAIGDIALHVIRDATYGENRVQLFCRDVRGASVRTLYERGQMSAFYPPSVRNHVDSELFRYSFWRLCMRWAKQANALDGLIDAQTYALKLLSRFADNIDRYTQSFCEKIYARWKRLYGAKNAPPRNIVHQGTFTRSQLRDIVNNLPIADYQVTITRLNTWQSN